MEVDVERSGSDIRNIVEVVEQTADIEPAHKSQTEQDGSGQFRQHIQMGVRGHTRTRREMQQRRVHSAVRDDIPCNL